MKRPKDHSGLLTKLLENRILILDGAMGTLIQQYCLTEADFRGERLFKDHSIPLKGNNDILSITKPDLIRAIHLGYFQAGANIVTTNTINSTTISQAAFGLEDYVSEINQTSARLAARARDEIRAQADSQDFFVAGSIGPTNQRALSPTNLADPTCRSVTVDELTASYRQQIEGLVAGGVDILLFETVCDTLNLKAAICAALDFFEEEHQSLPLMISVTIDRSGRTLSGETLEAFWHSIKYAKPLAVGINCSFGARHMGPFIREFAAVADCNLICYPNAGLPDPLSPTGYNEPPHFAAMHLKELAADGLLNLAGGCCGTGFDHIKAISAALKDIPPRPVPHRFQRDPVL